MYGKYECFIMQMFVSCVHIVTVLDAAFSWMQDATIWKRHIPEPSVSFCLRHVSVFIIYRGFCVCMEML